MLLMMYLLLQGLVEMAFSLPKMQETRGRSMLATVSSRRSLRCNKASSLSLKVFTSCQSLKLNRPFPLQHLDRELKKINTFIRADSRISANPVMKLLFGDPRLFLALLPKTSTIHSTSLWSCREKVSLLSLTHYVEQKDGRDNLPVLWRFLHKVKKRCFFF